MRGYIHHIELNVSNLEKSTAFWGWFLEELGYEPFQEWENGKSWKNSISYIVFVQTEKKYMDIPYHRKSTGLNHIAFHGESRQHIDDITSKLEERGIKILYKDRYPFAGGENYYAVFFEDPDKIKVELVAPSIPRQ